MSYDYDMVVVGSGPGGQKAAIQAAKLGRRVAVIECHGTRRIRADRSAIVSGSHPRLSGYEPNRTRPG
jgi:flavin-dependent dehydrogenase